MTYASGNQVNQIFQGIERGFYGSPASAGMLSPINYSNTFGMRIEDVSQAFACVATDRTGGSEDTIKKFLKIHPEKDLYLV
jgi:hypothetical protein